jgi:acyl carrier protein
MLFMKGRQASRFKSGRTLLSDEEFIARCGFEPETTAASLAVVVRRVIGECGSVEPTYIRPDDRWPEDLGKLAFWDSIDLFYFIFSVEEATGRRLNPDDELRHAFRTGFVVSELTQHIVAALLRAPQGAVDAERE